MRYLQETLETFAKEQFVLLSGPRQVGKTTLCEQWAQDGLILNWDETTDRKQILARTFLNEPDGSRIVLDELHKYARWKSWLKGIYDKHHKRLHIVVTGSARLDVFKRGGDSLFGRYEGLRLHPFSIGELTHGKLIPPPSDWLSAGERVESGLWEQLARRSGFPEPFNRDDALQHKRWSRRRRELLLYEDLRELSQIRSLSLVEHLYLLLPERVGSPLSVNSLREDLQVAHDTVSNWLDVFGRLYLTFSLSPYSNRLNRMLKKEAKYYLWDWSQLSDPGKRFENMVASHLLKAVHAWTDVGYGDYSLHYLRDIDKNEVDFVVCNQGKPLVLIECKLSDKMPTPALRNYGSRLNLPQVQLVQTFGVDVRQFGVRVISADKYLAALI